MKQRVVTLMWGTAWDRYGRKFVETFERHWPDEVELFIITDKVLPTKRATQIMLADVHGYTNFMERWGHKRKEIYLWKNDAVEWAPQGMAPRAALDGLSDGDILAWFDADVETIKDIPVRWLRRLLGKWSDKDMACLQRSMMPTELGFWCVRINADTRRMVRSFAALYSSGVVFEFPERHSGRVFDIALLACPLRVRNLNAADDRWQPWDKSLLAEFTVHHKGGKGR